VSRAVAGTGSWRRRSAYGFDAVVQPRGARDLTRAAFAPA